VGVHDQLGDEAAAYALGALTAAERQAFEAHLAGCPRCAAEVRSYAVVADGLGQLATPVDPGSESRAALLRQLPGQRRVPWAWLATAAAVALAIGAGSDAMQVRGQMRGLEARLRDAMVRADASERQVADARRSAFEAQSIVLVLAAPDLVRIDLAGQPAAPAATARAFWSRSRGLVFTASNLPAPPKGRAYQLWVLTTQPAPISAGMLTLDKDGRVNARFDTPPDLPRPVAMAVTLEPEGGVPAPTGDKYLVGLAN
jgi:anti-sigma-K factor RskA